MPKPLPKSLAQLNPTLYKKPSRRRLIVSVSGHVKTGKSRLGFTMPDPIGIIDIDKQVEYLIEEWEDKKALAHFPIKVPILYSQANSVKVWAEVYAKFTSLITVVMHGSTFAWQPSASSKRYRLPSTGKST
jgi:hypothetical protein